MKKLYKIGLVAAALIFAAAYAAAELVPQGLAGQTDNQTASVNGTSGAALARPVPLYEVRRAKGLEDRAYPGTVKATSEVDLSFRVAGPLVAVNVAPGTRVAKGQVLMRIDPRDYRDNIAMIEAQLAGAKAEYADVSLDLERLVPLIEKNVVSQSDFDQAESLHAMAEARVRGYEAQLSRARHQLEDTTLRAPFNGMVTAQLVENHEMVAAGQKALRMHDASTVEIHADIPESELCRYDLGQKHEVDVFFPAIGAKPYKAEFSEYSAEADPTTRTFEVTFTMPAPEKSAGVAILPGMTAEVSWTAPGRDQGPLVVPASAVSSNKKGETMVWVFDRRSGRAESRVVETGPLWDGSRLSVSKGLSEGDVIVAAGVDFIIPGMRLRPLGQ